MTVPEKTPSARETELLDAAYAYALSHGLGGLSLRPLAAAIGSSPRVLLYLFGSKAGLVRALLERARTDELGMLDRLRRENAQADLAQAAVHVWDWLCAPEHRRLLALWTEAYAHSVIDDAGPWDGFAVTTVEDWLSVLASFQPAAGRRGQAAAAQRTSVLALLRGCLLDLLATEDVNRTTAAIHAQLHR